MKCRVTVIGILLLMLVWAVGCTNLKEVETGGRSQDFITDVQAEETVLHFPEVVDLMRVDSENVKIEAVGLPSVDDPVYVVQVSEFKNNRWETFHSYTIDAQTGDIVE